MPWRTICAMDERMRFIVEYERGEVGVAELCRRAGISRKTGYKWLARYQAAGPSGLAARSSAPHRRPHTVPSAMVERLLAARAAHPTWGPKKLVVWVGKREPGLALPAPSTVGAVLKRAGLVVPRRHRTHATPTAGPLTPYTEPNSVWCADCKGQFRLGDASWCYPFTLTDGASRFLLRCQALPSTDGNRVRSLCEAAFREYGMPAVIRTDNGTPFSSVGLGGLSPLSVWWIELGIQPERSRRGRPGDNGRHERLHRTLKEQTAMPPAASPRAQQGAFDRFRAEYNTERPHEALGQRPPAELYTPTPRPFPTRPVPLTYPDADLVRHVRSNGELRWHRRLVYVSTALAGRPVGLTQLDDHRWSLAFGPVLLGYLDDRRSRVVPAATTRDTLVTHTEP
jgi:putative transposase